VVANHGGNRRGGSEKEKEKGETGSYECLWGDGIGCGTEGGAAGVGRGIVTQSVGCQSAVKPHVAADVSSL